MQKKILIISAVFPPEQVTSAYLNYDLAKALAKNYRVTVLRPNPTRPIGVTFQNSWSDPDFETVLIDSYTHPESELIGRFKEAVDFSRKATEYLKCHKDDIEFVYNDGWQLFGLYIIAKACVKYNIPYMVPIQDIYPECLFTKSHVPSFAKMIIEEVLLPFDKYYQKHAYRVRTISDEMRNYLSPTRKVPFDKYLVVNNWQNDEDFLKDYSARPDDGKVVFAYVGSINGHANVDLMIKAFVEANVENAEFRIFGGGNKKEYCVNLAKQLGAKNIIFDIVSRDKVPFIQSQAEVLVLALPSGNGNLCLPSKLTSYLLSGKPVLASVDQDSSTKRILEGNGCGKTVVPDDKEALTQGFQYFAGLSKEELSQMCNKSREYALQHLTREVNLSLVIESIKQAL